MNDSTILLLITPIILIEIGLLIFALRDLLRPERRVRGDSKLLWAIIIVLFQIIGPLLYFVVGRETE
jgi:hypothetical protein